MNRTDALARRVGTGRWAELALVLMATVIAVGRFAATSSEKAVESCSDRRAKR